MATAKRTGEVTLDDFVSEVIKAPGFGECLSLCDVQELERICDMIPEAFAAGRHGQADAYGLHVALMKNLYGPVTRYLCELRKWEHGHALRRKAELEKLSGEPVRIGPSNRMETEPSIEFLECIERVAERIEFGPWSDEDAALCADRLRLAWYKWIAYLSSYWMWAKVPRLLAAPKLSKRNGAMPAQDGKPGRPTSLDTSAILKAYDENLPSMGRGTAGFVARRFGCTRQYVNKLVRERDKQKNETNPVG